jgi:4-amino-4-deoxy-L-arabinose transferase-like glycosyltransferase
MEHKIFNKDFIVVVLLILSIFLLQVFGIFGRTTFPEDTSIIYEGGYRIFLHQIPFQDFSLPIGPIVFYIQAFFNLVFGPSFFSMALNSFVLSVILSVLFYFIVRKEMNKLMSFILSIFFYISYNGLSFHPFYNETAYFFFFLAIFLLFHNYKKDPIPLSSLLILSVLGAVTFYSKQDTGCLQIFLIGIYLLFNYRKQWKQIIFYYVIPVLVITIGIYFLLSYIPNFTFFFNLGQPPNPNRLLNIINPLNLLKIIESWKFYVAIALFFLLFKKNSGNSKKLMSLFIVIATTTLINYMTSGPTRQLSVKGIPVLIFILYVLIKDIIEPVYKNHKFASNLIVVFLIILAINPFSTYGLITLNYFDPNIGRISEGCYNGFPMNKASLEDLKIIRNEINKSNNNFISLTEYSFLYCDYNVSPPKNLPLFFQRGVGLFNENIPDILKNINSTNPKLILWQDPNRIDDMTFQDEFEANLSLLGYKRVGVVNGSGRVDIPQIRILIKEDL